jgi:hypothetical protein
MKIIEERAGYLFVAYDGATDSASLISLMEEMAQICRAKNLKKILADLRDTVGRPNLFQRYELGVMGAIILRGLQIALVYHADENNRFAESVAVNRGLTAIVTHDMEKAKDWLGVK